MPALDRPRRDVQPYDVDAAITGSSADDSDYEDAPAIQRAAVGTAIGIVDEADEERDEGAVPEPPLKKPRGRPRKDKAPDMAALFQDDMEEEYHPVFSLTYGKGKSHMPPIWHTSMSEFLDKYASRYVNSRERGAKDELLHGQAVAALPIDTDKKALDRVVKMMKAALGVVWGDGSGCKITFKLLVIGQTWERMVGYCFKDQGLGHFLTTHKGVSDAEIARGIAEHMSLKLNYMDDKIALNKSNLFQRVHTSWVNHLDMDGDVTFDEVVATMFNSKKYMVASTLIMNNQGQMRGDAAETYWRIIKGGAATKWDVQRILYVPVTGYNTFRGYHGGLNEPVPDATPERPAARVDLREYEEFDDGTLPTDAPKYQKIKAYLARVRPQQAIAMESEEEQGEHDRPPAADPRDEEESDSKDGDDEHESDED